MALSSDADADPFGNVPTTPGRVTGKAGKLVLAGLAVFVLWALFIPLDSAVIAPGELASSARNHKLQHVSGGVVMAMQAREGDLVEKGDVILTLDPATDQARLTKLRAQYAELMALRTRLEAEKAGVGMAGGPSSGEFLQMTLRGLEGSDLPIEQDVADQPFAQRLNSEQLRELEKGRQAITAELRGLEKRLDGQQRRLAVLTTQLQNGRERIEILTAQLTKSQALAEQGYMARRQVQDLEIRVLDARNELSNLQSQVASTEGEIGGTLSEIDRVKLLDSRETSKQLTEVLAKIEQISDELTAAENARSQTELRAPVKGYLVHLAAVTVGGVIRPGEAIGEIVPADAPLEVKAQISLDKIAGIFPGEDAEVKISALNPRTHDPIPAEVTYVAADATQNEVTGEHFFEVRALLDKETLQQQGLSLKPGMGGEVFIKGEARTFATYLLQPFLDSLSHSFREVR